MVLKLKYIFKLIAFLQLASQGTQAFEVELLLLIINRKELSNIITDM